MEQYTEILKEIRELSNKTSEVKGKVDMLLEVKEDVKEVREVACRADKNAGNAQERLNKIDKYTFAMWSAIFLALVGSVLGLILK